MKNAANCEMYYETQETTNHQIFERKRHWGVIPPVITQERLNLQTSSRLWV